MRWRVAWPATHVGRYDRAGRHMLLTIGAFVVALGVLIIFHELGHYWVARLSGVRILRFSVGFGRVVLRRHDRRGTEWALSAIPLGGYVKMLDEASPEAGSAARTGAFNTQPLPRRVAVVLAGPAANLLLAALLYAFLAWWGSLQPVAVLSAPPSGSAAASAGITAGSVIRSVDGTAVQSWPQARWHLLEPLSLGEDVSLALVGPSQHEYRVTLHAVAQEITPAGPDPLAVAGLTLAQPQAVLGTLTSGGVAAAAGLHAGDRVLRVGSLDNPTVGQFVDAVRQHPGQSLQLTVERAGRPISLALRPDIVNDGGSAIGRIGALVQGERPQVLVREGLWSGLRGGFARTWDTSLFSLRMLGRMVTGSVPLDNLSGPVTIAEYAGQTARIGWQAYLNFLALISISIGVLNLLPIPMLDGGHLLFYLLEYLRGGRPVPERVRDLGYRVGMSLVAGLMILAIFNDLARLFR